MAIRSSQISLHSQILELARAARSLVKEEGPFYASEQDWAAFHLAETPIRQEPKSEGNRILQPRAPLEEPPPEPKPTPKPPEPAALRQSEPEQPTPPTPKLKESPPPPISVEFETFRKLFAHIAPQIPLVAAIPSDARAKAIAERWKTKNQAAPYSILSFNEPKEHQSILRNLSTAIDTVFGGGRFIEAAGIEKEGRWESFLSAQEVKLIIVCDYALWQQPALMKFYRELQSKGERYLLNTPLFLLPDLSLYLKDPLLKRSLWKALSRMTERG